MKWTSSDSEDNRTRSLLLNFDFFFPLFKTILFRFFFVAKSFSFCKFNKELVCFVNVEIRGPKQFFIRLNKCRLTCIFEESKEGSFLLFPYFLSSIDKRHKYHPHLAQVFCEFNSHNAKVCQNYWNSNHSPQKGADQGALVCSHSIFLNAKFNLKTICIFY